MNETATSPGITYTYDNAGNMISANNGTTITTYTYDFHNRLTEVTQGGTVIATYVYDALNRRIGVDDNGTQTWTIYDGTNPYADFNGSGTLQERYQYGPGVVDGAIVDQLLARTSSGGTTAWYLPDKLGSVRDIVSTTGTELDHIVYDSFGNIVTETNAANGDRFKFAGMQFDSTIGQYYDNARWYGPGVGRFDKLDPKGFSAGDVDLYRYVGNSPPNGVDPTGLSGGQFWGDYWHYLNNPGDMDPDLQTIHEAAISTAIVSTSIATGGATAGAAGMQFVAASSVWAPLHTVSPLRLTAAPAFKYRYFVERRPAPRLQEMY